ncbi:cobalamin-binding protein [Gloeomargaritales cyanobacterium VI4D9]|nr:cobalamin-binding protein [Gloeomargaritales cyanobacterium VI4D9]
MRLVSLLPSATEIVHELGLTASLVGRSHECDYPPAIQALPVCTAPKFDPKGDSRQVHERVMAILHHALSVYELNLATLHALQPTHILTQAQCEVCAVSLADVTQAVAAWLTPHPEVISLQPQTLGQVWQDIALVGEKLGVDPALVLQNLHRRIAQVQQAVRGLPSLRVLCIEWLDPLMSAGNWVPELVQLAGGQPLLAQVGAHSPWLTWAQVERADPDVIVVMPCGYDLARTVQAWQDSPHPWGKLRAVQAGQVYATDGNAYFNRPGPRLVDSLEILAAILHPGWDGGQRGQGWCPLAEGK